MKGIDATSTRYPFLLGKWTPGGLELPERVPGDLEQAATIGVHLIEVDILVLSRCGSMHKDDLRSVRRPGRPAVALIRRQLDQVCAVREDRVELRCGAIGEGAEGLEEDARAIRRPMRKPRLQFSPRCHLLQTGAIPVDYEQRLIVIRIMHLVVAHKEDLLAIGRPGGEVISNTCRVWGLCELHGMAAIGMHDPERLISRVAVGTNRILRHTIDNLAAIGRP